MGILKWKVGITDVGIIKPLNKKTTVLAFEMYLKHFI